MDGYLIDTQTLCYWLDPAQNQNPRVTAVVDALPAASPLYISTITLGEIRYGQQISPQGNGPRRAAFDQSLRTKVPQFLEVSHHTAESYGEIRALLADKFAPKKGWTKKRRAEQMEDPISGLKLGIDENDLWIVAQAVERHLVLATADRMGRIREAVGKLYPDFQIEDWTALR